MTLYCLENARDPEQRARMVALEAAGVCLFCPAERTEMPLWSSEHWYVVENDFPYAGARKHLLVVPRKHAGELLDLDEAVLADFWPTLRQARDLVAATHYGLGVRSGDCTATGATIEHVHAHVLVANVPADQPLRMRFSGR